MIPVIEAALNNGKPVEMTVTGNSMKPMLRDRVSSVKLAKPDNLRKGDIVLFLRNDGHYVLHRIINIYEDLYDIVGDNQLFPDRNISEEKIIAKVCEFSRDGRKWKDDDRLYRVFLPALKVFRHYGIAAKRKLGTIIRYR